MGGNNGHNKYDYMNICSFAWSVTSREEQRHAMILFVGKMPTYTFISWVTI